jgi:hypothetical protein
MIRSYLGIFAAMMILWGLGFSAGCRVFSKRPIPQKLKIVEQMPDVPDRTHVLGSCEIEVVDGFVIARFYGRRIIPIDETEIEPVTTDSDTAEE